MLSRCCRCRIAAVVDLAAGVSVYRMSELDRSLVVVAVASVVSVPSLLVFMLPSASIVILVAVSVMSSSSSIRRSKLFGQRRLAF